MSKLTDEKIQKIVQEYLEWKKQDLEEWVLDKEGPFDDVKDFKGYLDALNIITNRAKTGLLTGNYELVESTVNDSLEEHGIRDVKKVQRNILNFAGNCYRQTLIHGIMKKSIS